MPKSHKGHKFVLCIIDEVTNYLITVLIYQSRSEEIGDALIENILDYIIMDQDSTFMSLLMNDLFKRLNIRIMTIASYNHQSLQAEHGIISLSMILPNHLTDLRQMQPKYLPLVTVAYNTSNTPNLANYSPYELGFGKKLKLLLDLETNPDIKVSGTFRLLYIAKQKMTVFTQVT